MHCQAEAVLLLLSLGVDPNIKGQNGMTPLHIAAENGFANLVQVLLRNGAYVDAKGKELLLILINYTLGFCNSTT